VLSCGRYDLSIVTWFLDSMFARRPEKHLSTSFLWYLCLLLGRPARWRHGASSHRQGFGFVTLLYLVSLASRSLAKYLL
jgi:hypothetical protein